MNLLLVEDSPADARLIQRLLKAGERPIQLTLAERLDEACAKLAEGSFDLMLLDLGLQDSRGLESVRRIVRQSPQLPIVVLTALDNEGFAMQAMRLGVADYLVKGRFNAELLIRTLRHALDRKKAEQQLLLQATALATAANGILIAEANGTIVWTNPAMSVLTQFSSEELLGQNPRLFKSGHHTPEFYRGFWRTILAGIAWHGEFVNRRKDGSLYYCEQTVTPVKGANQQVTHFVGIVQDITVRKEADAQIRRMNAELERRVRERTAQLEAANKELEAFSYSVSHDLRAPLRHIDGFVALLTESAGLSLSDHSRRYLEIISNSARKMRQLIDDLLVFSQMGRTQVRVEPVDLRAMVNEVIRTLELDLKDRNVRWNVGDLPLVQADPNLLHQVLVNLLANAVKYTRPRDPAIIEVASLEENPAETVVVVRDNGVGFEMQYAGKLFGVFQRLHLEEDFEGTGIGLANVRRIISRHGGRTWAEGKVDGGAAFYFSLPKPQSDSPGINPGRLGGS